MEKIFKKSLALVLSAALCLTALLGCLTVSAEETANPSYVLNDVAGAPNSDVTVTATLTNIIKVCAHYIDVVFPSDFTINGVTDNLGNTYLEYSEWEKTADADKGCYKLVEDTDGTHVRMVEFVNWDEDTAVDSMDLSFSVHIQIGRAHV